MSKPTEGPYTAEGADIRGKDGNVSIALVNSHPPEYLANRRLLAKSWEMREALRDVFEMCEEHLPFGLGNQIAAILTEIDGDSE